MRKRSTLALLLLSASLAAEPIAVKQTQGSTRGFLIVRTPEGKVIAHGELNQTAHGDRATSHLTYRFLDGSIDDETTVYTQRGTFQLVRDHHTQKGPYFKDPIDYVVDMPAGTVTSRSIGKDGKEKIEVEHKDMPPDTYNGLIAPVLLNTPFDTPEFKVGMIAPTGKGRDIRLAILPAGHGTVQIAGIAMRSDVFRVKVELGGLTGAIAPMVGKQPLDVMVWVLPGEAPGLIREISQFYPGGPTVSIELSGATFAKLSEEK